jgi:hypothetical protein
MNPDPMETDIMRFAIQQLTSQWSEEEKQKFHGFCYTVVAENRYKQLAKFPSLNTKVIRR